MLIFFWGNIGVNFIILAWIIESTQNRASLAESMRQPNNKLKKCSITANKGKLYLQAQVQRNYLHSHLVESIPPWIKSEHWQIEIRKTLIPNPISQKRSPLLSRTWIKRVISEGTWPKKAGSFLTTPLPLRLQESFPLTLN